MFYALPQPRGRGAALFPTCQVQRPARAARGGLDPSVRTATWAIRTATAARSGGRSAGTDHFVDATIHLEGRSAAGLGGRWRAEAPRRSCRSAAQPGGVRPAEHRRSKADDCGYGADRPSAEAERTSWAAKASKSGDARGNEAREAERDESTPSGTRRRMPDRAGAAALYGRPIGLRRRPATSDLQVLSGQGSDTSNPTGSPAEAGRNPGASWCLDG